MPWILGIVAVLCIIYYIVIVLYSGFTTSFSLIWLLIAGALLLTAVANGYYHHNRDRVPLWMPVSWITVLCTGILVFCVVETMIFMGVAGGDAGRLDYLIVLGAKVKEEGISTSLRKRLDKAIEYVEQNPDTILVLSGGQGPDEPFSEALAMRDYLLFNGVTGQQMLVETRSESTVENIAYSRLVIEANQEKVKAEREKNVIHMPEGTYKVIEEKPVKIGVLTSDFHVFRAKLIARKWGIPDIHGIACESDPVLFVHFCVRECVAILKDKLMGNM